MEYPFSESDRDDNVMITISENEVIGVRLSTWVYTQTQRKLSVDGFVSVLNKIGLETGDLDLISFQVFFIEAYEDYSFFRKKVYNEVVQTNKLDERDCCDLFDRMGGFLKTLELISIGIKTHIPKNLEAPPAGAISQ